MSTLASSEVDGTGRVTTRMARRAQSIAGASTHVAGHDIIGFGSGHACPSVLPDMRAAADIALSRYRAETLQYGPRLGIKDMREWLSQYLATDGVNVKPSEIIVTNGAKNGLELVCQLLIDEGDTVVVTAPTYFTAIPLFRSFGAQFIEVGHDNDGLDVDELSEILKRRQSAGLALPKFIYDVPEFHNPTGLTMPLARRQRLVELAASQGILIVEDSPYRRVRFEGENVPPIKSLDADWGVLTVGSFAKLLAPGLRVGWVTAPEAMIGRMASLKCDGGTCPLTQRIILEFAGGEGLVSHTERVRSTYRLHRDAMVTALKTHLPDARCRVPEGGYYIWVELPAHVDGDRLAASAARKGVDLIGGSKFFAGSSRGFPRNHGRPKNFVRLAYSDAEPEQINRGVERIAAAYREICD